MRYRIALFLLTLCFPAMTEAQEKVPAAKLSPEQTAFFENEVRPILVKRCYECHSEESGKRKGGLWLDRKAGWHEGGDSGEAIVPGNVEDSLLVYTIRYEDPGLAMPPKGRMPKEEIATLEKWIATGASDPRDQAMAGAVREGEIDYEAAKRYWAFRPLEEHAPPEVDDADWPTSDIDRFIATSLKAEGLTPAADGNPRHLIRRLFYDLTGLPPTRAEVEAFVGNSDHAVYEELVDDLLSRKDFGEKWGKHWLDVARYADSNGGDRNFTFHHAWRYRNYVIDSFNNDKPYYDFVREQIAGDLLPAESDEQRRDQLIGSTFLSLGPKMLTERDKEKLFMDTADEQLDTTGRAFLGLTLGCARCHDHKFDPISQEDYYAMAGIFRSTEVVMGTRNGCVNVASWVEQPLPGEGSEELAKKVDRLELAMKLTVEKVYSEKSGNKSGDTGGRKLPLGGVIVDNEQAELIGKWRKSTLSPNRYGGSYIVSEGKNDKVIFRATVPKTGVYVVRMAYSYENNRCKSVPVTVENHEGEHPAMVDETEKPETAGLFKHLGCWLFEKDGTCNITIEPDSSKEGYVIVDAVQIILVDDIPQETKALAAQDDGGKADPIFTMTSGQLKKEISRLIKELKSKNLAMAPRDVRQPKSINLRVRGEVSQLGPKVARGIPKVLSNGAEFKPAAKQSGRRELADWMVRPDNALLDRVMVNRIWHHLFGQGIVQTVDNFGRLGSAPTHPELLDWLAARFRKSNGSVKSLVKDIVLSRTYRLSCDHADVPADAVNPHFARQNRRRLSAEEIRDSVLFLSGELDRKTGGATSASYAVDLDKPMNFEKNPLRTVYLPVARNNAVAEMALFDAANPDLVDGNRPETTVPTQALYLLNSKFVQAQADKIAAKVPDGAGIEWLYETILGRAPAQSEVNRANAFVAEFAGEKPDAESLKTAHGHLAHLLLASTEFLFLD